MKFLKLLSFILLATFSLNTAKAQTITITQPNGGEVLYACQTYLVKWNITGSPSGYYNIDYSLNGGSIWTSVASNYLAPSNQFSWTVPNIQSSTVLMRVQDKNNTLISDVSDANFTINIPVTVTAPNGGQTFTPLTTTNITWNAAGTSNTYNIYYSINNGSSWLTVVTNYSTTGGTYSWTVPNNPSTTCLVKVQDYVTSCMSDVSNTTFTIVPLTPTVTSPNGGELLSVGQNYTITWNAATYYSSVRIEYSLNNGVSWISIISSASNNGTYSGWYVPYVVLNSAYTQCLIKVSQTSDLTRNDVSNATFTIKKPITVTYPNGGEVFNGCGTMSINGTANTSTNYSSSIQSWTISYSTNGGANWTAIVGNYPSPSYNWSIPNGINSTNCKIRIMNTYQTQYGDTSDVAFSILPSNDITVTAPNGGETFAPGSTQTISWTNTGNVSGAYLITYNYGSGSTTIASNITGNSYSWTVPNIPSTTYKITVSDYNNSCKSDESDANFSVTPQTPVMTSPNGGQTIYYGETNTITWNSATYYSSVRIDVSIDNGISWIPITTSTTNNGSYSWTETQTNTYSNQCLIKVSQTSDLTRNDVSNAVFTIKPAVTILTPNGGEELGGCTITSISIDHSSVYTSYTVQYSPDNGSTWQTLTSTFTTSSGHIDTYNWTLPSISSNQAMARVYPNTLGLTYSDVSNSVFTVVRPVTIIQPNFGGTMLQGSTYTISWSSDGISNFYDLYYSTNGGTNWTTIIIGYNTSLNTYSWTVPNLPSTNCLIKVTDNINSCKLDISDIPFTISTTPAAITLTSPNGNNDTLIACATNTVTWTDSPTIGTYDLAYSLNSGSTWINIATSYVTTLHSYDWVVPNSIVSNTILLRVRSTSTPGTFDLTDAFFSVKPAIGSSVASVAITAAPSSIICSGTLVTFTATPTNGGSSPVYQWKKNGVIVGTNSITFSSSSLTNSDLVTCVMTSNLPCVAGSPATSNAITMTVTPSVAASVSISSTGSSICTGNSITFTASPTNGGSTPVYQWQVNGLIVGSNSITFTSSLLNNGDVVKVIMTSNAICATGSPATSNLITVTVSPIVPASVSITSTGSAICSGNSVTFTATPTNGGTTPAYQWKVNGTNAGSNSATFTSSLLINTDVVTVVMTSALPCATGSPATSNAITMTVTQSVTASVSVSASVTTICAGSLVTFTATPTNGGSTPVYQWKVNGTNAGSNSVTFTSSLLNNGDVVKVVMTSNAVCAAGSPATSNSITITVSTNVSASVSISSTGSNICAGSSITFTSTTTNGGTTPAYQWQVNGINAGSNSPTFASSALVNADVVKLIMTSNLSCATGSPTTSNTITVTVSPIVPASASITATSSTICAGSPVTFTAVPTNGGTTPTYQWQVNGTSAGSNSATFTSSVLTNSSVVQVIMTSGLTCVSGSPFTSNAITITVNPLPLANAGSDASIPCNGSTTLNATGGTSYTWLPATGLSATNIANPVASPTSTTTYTVSVSNGTCSASDNVIVSVSSVVANAGADVTICNGNSTTLSASGGTTYSWAPATGLSATNISNPVANPSMPTTYTVTATTGSCSSTDMVIVTVTPLPSTPVITLSGNNLVSSATSGNQWYLNGTIIGGAINQTYSPTASGNYTVVVTSNNCSATSSIYVHTIIVTYCIPNPTTGTTDGDFIDGVVLGSINNTASGSATGPDYTNYTSTMSTIVIKSSTYSIAITSGTYQPDNYAAWIDYNQDGDFIDAGEKLGEFASTGVNQTQNIGFTVPVGAITGATTLRVRCVYGNPPLSPCTDYTYGETEDYKVVIQTSPSSAPVADFTANSTTICAGSTVAFSDQSTNAPTSWLWTFTGGTPASSTLQNPSVTYNTSGSYSVTLVATNSFGSTTKNNLNYIVVVSVPPTATITLSGSNLVSSAITGNQWYLDGNIIVGAINQTYTPTVSGNYTVMVTSSGCSSTSSVYTFTIPVSYCIPNPSTGTTGGDFINGVVLGSISNTASGSSTGPNYTSYVSTMSTNVTTNATYSIAITSGTYQADNFAAWIDYNHDGDFNDAGEKLGEFASTAPNQTQNIGFTVPVGALTGVTSLRVRCVYGNAPLDPCTNYTYGETEDYKVVIQTSSIPVANFTANITTVCAGSTVVFADQSSGVPTSWAWTFTGGTPLSSALQNPSVVYNTAGSYNVTLVASNSFGSSTKNNLNFIVVVNSITANAGADVSICAGTSTTLSASGGTTYLWSPTTGLNAANIASPVANPTATTTYSVVVSNGSCSATDVVILTVKQLPTVSLSPLNPVCSNASAFALSGGSPAGGVYSGTGVSSGTTFTPSVAGIGTYIITYSINGTNGCSNTASSAIAVSVCTDILTQASNDDVIVYPNPFNSSCTIKIGGGIILNSAEIKVFDVLGKQVINITNIHSQEIKLERNDLESGIYFYQFLNNNQIVRAGKLVIE